MDNKRAEVKLKYNLRVNNAVSSLDDLTSVGRIIIEL